MPTLVYGVSDPVVSYSITGYAFSGLPKVAFAGDPLISGNIIGSLKDWHRIAIRYDRCAMTFLSAVALAATVLFRL